MYVAELPSPTVSETGSTITRLEVFSTVTVYVRVGAEESSGVTTTLTVVDGSGTLTVVTASLPFAPRVTAEPFTVTVARGSLVVGLTVTVVVAEGTRTV